MHMSAQAEHSSPGCEGKWLMRLISLPCIGFPIAYLPSSAKGCRISVDGSCAPEPRQITQDLGRLTGCTA